MTIFIIGYMGSGKSSFGKKLALKLNHTFIDLDKYIETQSQLSIPEIFEKKGEVHFRELEHEALKMIICENNVVIATGGGTPCYYNNMELMQKNGISIYLQSPIELLLNRLKKSKKERPLLQEMNDEELKEFVQQSLQKREVFYLKANYIIDAKNASPEQLANIIQYNVGFNKDKQHPYSH